MINNNIVLRCEEEINQLINDYSKEVVFDDTLGTLSINGSKNLPHSKQIWVPVDIISNLDDK